MSGSPERLRLDNALTAKQPILIHPNLLNTRRGEMKKPRPNTKPRHKPRFEGEVVGNLYCPCGWCKERHSRAVAKELNFDGTKFLAW